MRRRFVVVAFVLVVVGGAVVVYRDRHSNLGEYGAVFVVSRAGAGLRQLTNDQRFHESEAWSPDGRSIALTTKSVDAHGIDIRGPLEFLHPSGGKAKEVWLEGFGTAVVWRGNWSIKVLVTPTYSKVVDTRLLDVAPGGLVTRGASIGRIGGAAWAPNADALAVLRCSHRGTRWGVDVLSTDGSPRRPLGLLPGPPEAGACEDPAAAASGDLAWAPDGRSLFVFLQTRLLRLSVAGIAQRRIESDVIPSSVPEFSPDGRQIVLSAIPHDARPGAAADHLYLLPSAGGPARLLTRDAAQGPAWSSDGTIAFVSGAGDTIKSIRPDGSGETTLAQLPGNQISALSWSPTGQQLVFDAAVKRPET